MIETNLTQSAPPQALVTNPQTIETDPLAQLAAQNKKKSSSWGYITGSLIFPPFTTVWVMYLAWKKGALQQLMPTMTIVYTVFFVLWSLLMVSAPGAFGDYLSQQVAGVPVFDKLVAFTLAGLGIGLGIYLKIKANRDNKFSWIWVGVLSAILILQLWAGYHQLGFIGSVVNRAQDINLGL